MTKPFRSCFKRDGQLICAPPQGGAAVPAGYARRFSGGLLVYSFWSGYKSQPEMSSFLEQCEQMGLRIVTLHTSGHADEEAIRRLIDTVHPTTILPVHTENPGWFGGIVKNIP
jgi:predicted TIM-barrel fold metal-dependent hydrolase